MRWLLRVAAFAAALVGSAGAAGAETNGLKFGDGRVHPYFDLESRYDTAAGFNPAGSTYIGDLLLHFKPGVKVDVPSPKFSVLLNGNLDYVLYTSFSAASRLQGDADIDLGINRGGQFGVDLGNHFTRSDRSMTASVVAGVLSLYDDARIQLNIRPSGGALEVQPNYHLSAEFFSPLVDSSSSPSGCSGDPACDPSQASKLNYLNHLAGLQARWKFLPKTAFVLDGTYGFRSYLGGGGTTGTGYMKASAGLAGLLTTHLATVLKVGYGYDVTQGTYSSVIAQAEIGYLLSETGQVRLGYVRTFEPVGSSTYVTYGDDRGYFDARFLLGGRLTARGQVGFDNIGYRAKAGATGGRTDQRVGVDVGADYEFKQWFSAGLGYLLTFQSSNQSVFFSGGTFSRNEIYLRLHLIY